MNEPSFKTFFINSKHDYKKASLYKKAYKEILSENLFDKDFYIKKYFQKEELNMDPLIHYLFFGYKEHKVPNLDFDGDIYLDNYPEVKKLDINIDISSTKLKENLDLNFVPKEIWQDLINLKKGKIWIVE